MYRERPSRLPGAVLWRQDTPGTVRVLPDGCMDLMVAGDRLLLAGPDTTAALVHTPQPLSGIRFPPGLAPFLLGIPASAVRDQRPDLAEVRRLRPAADLEELALRLAADSEIPRWTDALVLALRQGGRIDRIADDLGWSARQLHRKCLHAFGYGPSVLGGILRFQRAMALARTRPWANAATAAGYADQAHLARETRRLAGVTMTQLRRESAQLQA